MNGNAVSFFLITPYHLEKFYLLRTLAPEAFPLYKDDNIFL